MKVAYADPPYIGKAKKHYDKHGDYAGEVNHVALIAQLVAEFPDGWALSCNSTTLRYLLPLCPPDVRVGVWAKTFAVMKKGVYPTYAWEPVIFHGGRNLNKGKKGTEFAFLRDWCSGRIAFGRGTVGAKPDYFCNWLFLLLGLQRGDELVDLFPGSGAVTQAWEKWQQQFAWMVA